MYKIQYEKNPRKCKNKQKTKHQPNKIMFKWITTKCITFIKKEKIYAVTEATSSKEKQDFYNSAIIPFANWDLSVASSESPNYSPDTT